MHYIKLLQESVNRIVQRRLRPTITKRIYKLLIKKQFLSDLEDSDGKMLLNFFSIHEPKSQHIGRADIYYFLKKTINIPLTNTEISVIYNYMESMGADTLRTNKAIFFTNVMIKRRYAGFNHNGIVYPEYIDTGDFTIPTRLISFDDDETN